ncbi:MAG: nucleoside 2-deoxyribosyltransferase domain-containing protein [Blastocatellia bacterium]
MQGRLILPPDYLEITGLVVFLAGPIQGTNWQPKAIEYLQKNSPELNIACPRRDYLANEFVYEKQVDWETYYLRKAAHTGVIMFWLAKELFHICDRAYAQTTRFELGEWKVRYERDNIKLVLGIEEGFSNSRYIRRRFAQDCPNINICNTLEETCQQVIKQIFIK